MGHYSHTCKLTGLPITGGTPVVLFPMVMSNKLYGNSEDRLRKTGSTYMCSNDGNHLKFIPCYFPIRGTYDDYGGIEDIIEDDGTKVLEKYFDLSIQEICNVITCGRKDDGYDSESLDCIKDPEAKDENGKLLGEDGFRDYGNPQYLKRYQELISVSGMWIHRDVYDKLTEPKPKEGFDEYGGLDLGTPQFLEALGFTELKEKGTDERYNRQFQKGSLIINSDGTWINVPNESVYRISDLAKYCEKMGEPIEDLDSHLGKTYVEQLFDYVIPNYKKFWKRPNQNKDDLDPPTDEEIAETIAEYKEMGIELTPEQATTHFAKEALRDYMRGYERIAQTIAYKLLDTGGYSANKISNPIVFDYYDACKDGKLKDVLTRFWRFDSYMFATGTFYDIVGTAPQDGEIDKVKEVIDTAKIVADEKYKYYHEDDYDNSEDCDEDSDIRI